MNRWGKKALRFYLAGNASGCHMPNMRDSKHRPLQMICSVCCNQQGFHAPGRGLEMYRKPHKCFAVLYCLRQSLHPFQHHKRTGKASLMGQAQMSLQMVLRYETGGFTGKFQVRRTAWLA